MLQLSPMRLTLALLAVLLLAMVAPCIAQDDPNEAPLGDVARNLRKKTPTSPSQGVIDDDNFSQLMQQAESRHAQSSTLKYMMAGESKGFQVSAPDVTCSLAFTANAKSLLSSQYAQMDLPSGEVLKLEGPATIEGDALTVSVLNRTDWHVSEVEVALTVVRRNAPAAASLNSSANSSLNAALNYGTTKLASEIDALPESEVRPEKKPDTTVIYRMRAAAPPSMTTVFSAPLNLDMAPGDEWHWAIVQAKGYPPQSYSGSVTQATAETNDLAPARPGLSPALLEPQGPPDATPQQTPQ